MILCFVSITVNAWSCNIQPNPLQLMSFYLSDIIALTVGQPSPLGGAQCAHTHREANRFKSTLVSEGLAFGCAL